MKTHSNGRLFDARLSTVAARVSDQELIEHPGSGLPFWLCPGRGERDPRVTLILDETALAAIHRMTLEQLGALVAFSIVRAATPALPWHASQVAVAARGKNKADPRVRRMLSDVLAEASRANKAQCDSGA